MNISRRIKLLSAAGALSLTGLAGLITAAPAHALAVTADRPTTTSYWSYYTWYLPDVWLTPMPGSSCQAFSINGYSTNFRNVSSVTVQLYEEDIYGNWDQLVVDNNNPDADVFSVDTATGAITGANQLTDEPLPLSIGAGQYAAWVTDTSNPRNTGETFSVSCS